MKMGIRVDGNKTIGTGHVMRCIAIAKAAIKMDVKVIFITADEMATEIIRQNKFEYLCLNSSYKNFNEDISATVDIIKQNNINSLLVDSYFVTENYFLKIKKYLRTIYIDDLFLISLTADLLINYNLYSDKFNYLNGNTKNLIGTSYAPLREEFANISRNQINRLVKNVLITTGGTDIFNFCGELLLSNKLPEECSYNIIVGRYFTNVQSLKEIAESRQNVNLLFNVESMSALMLENDIAISAGGITLYEITACGLPSICFSFVDNQIDAVKAFEEKGIMLYSGDIRKNREICINKTIANLVRLMDYQLRYEISHKMQKIVDGKGTERIMHDIIKNLYSNCS